MQESTIEPIVKVYDRHQSFRSTPLDTIPRSEAARDVRAGLADWHSNKKIMVLRANHPNSTGEKGKGDKPNPMAQSLKPGLALVERYVEGDKKAQAIIHAHKWAPIVSRVEGDRRTVPSAYGMLRKLKDIGIDGPVFPLSKEEQGAIRLATDEPNQPASAFTTFENLTPISRQAAYCGRM